jgi:hypothetical protein
MTRRNAVMSSLGVTALVVSAVWMIAAAGANKVEAKPVSPASVFARSKSAVHMSPEQLQLRKIERQRKADEYLAKIRPAVDSAMAGDYEGALEHFKKLEEAGNGTFARQKAMCLLRLGRASDGIQLMRAARGQTERDRSVLLCLAVSAGDRETMLDCLAEAERSARTQAAFGRQSYAAIEAARAARIRESEIDVPRRLMETALDLGGRYDREGLNLLGDEAIRRGEKDCDLLIQYAGALETNGQIRKCIGIYKVVERTATDPMHKRVAEAGIYDMRNATVMNHGDSSVDEWEADLQRRARRYHRRFWN